MTVPATRRLGLGRTALGLLVALALLLALVALQPWWLATLLAWRLEAGSGRSVRFDSARVGLSWQLEPVVHARGVRIANAAWADSTRPFVAVGEVVIRMSWRSIAEQRPVIGLLVLRDGEVDLERRADGVRNWRLRDPENRGPGRYKVLALQAERARLRFKHGGIDLDLLATSTPNDAGAPAAGTAPPLPTRITLDGSWRALPFAASVATGPVLTFLETGETFPLRGSVAAGGARLEADGRAGDIFRAPVFDARIDVAGDALAPFRAFIGPRHDGLGKRPFRVDGQLQAADGRLSLRGAKGQVGATDLGGDIEITRQADRSVVRARLQSDSADAADLRWLVGRTPDAAVAAIAAAKVASASGSAAQRSVDAASAARAAGSGAAAAPPLRPPFAFARAGDVDLAIEIRRLRAAELPWLRSLALEAMLVGGRLDVARLDAGVLQGQVKAKGSYDMRAEPAAAKAELTLRGVRIESLLGEQPAKKRVTGMLQASARVEAAGDTTEALVASATGSVDASLTGTLSALLDAEIGLQGGKILRGLIGGPETIAIRCAVAAVDLRQGRGRIRQLVVDTERTRTVGTGSVDLGRRTFDLVLTPEAKEGGLLILDRSIHVHGPLKKPARELVARAEVSAASRQACARGSPAK